MYGDEAELEAAGEEAEHEQHDRSGGANASASGVPATIVAPERRWARPLSSVLAESQARRRAAAPSKQEGRETVNGVSCQPTGVR